MCLVKAGLVLHAMLADHSRYMSLADLFSLNHEMNAVRPYKQQLKPPAHNYNDSVKRRNRRTYQTSSSSSSAWWQAARIDESSNEQIQECQSLFQIRNKWRALDNVLGEKLLIRFLFNFRLQVCTKAQTDSPS